MKPVLPVTPFFHANLQYAEISHADIKDVVEKSYLPTLGIFERNTEFKGLFEFSGITLEILEKDFPEAIDKIRNLLIQGNIELMGSTYANPVLSLIPLDHASKQIAKFLEIYDRLFGDLNTRPAGFYTQEFFVDVSLIPLFTLFKYAYTISWAHSYINIRENRLNHSVVPQLDDLNEIGPDLKRELLAPFIYKGAFESRINSLPLNGDLIQLMRVLAAEGQPGMYVKEIESIGTKYGSDGSNLLLLGPSDFEFVGFLPLNKSKKDCIRPEWMEDTLNCISKSSVLKFRLPREHFAKYKPTQEVYAKCGGDMPSLDVWTKDADNLRLNYLCDQAATQLREIEHKIAKADLKKDKATQVKLNEIWDLVLLSENSDGRGFMPVPERRMFCYEKALLALEKIEVLNNQLIFAGTAEEPLPKSQGSQL